jgi:hypothetical protein
MKKITKLIGLLFVLGLIACATPQKRDTYPTRSLADIALLTATPPLEATYIVVDIFSGRPNPTWYLSDSRASELYFRIENMPLTEQVFSENESLGYRGLLVSSLDKTIRIFGGVIQVTRYEGDETVTIYYEDTQHQIEKFILATGEGHPELESIISEIEASFSQ